LEKLEHICGGEKIEEEKETDIKTLYKTFIQNQLAFKQLEDEDKQQKNFDKYFETYKKKDLPFKDETKDHITEKLKEFL
jgi:recombinational DNA repair protein (RecF pathway)